MRRITPEVYGGGRQAPAAVTFVDVGDPLPLFPLGTVLFPGMPLPLLVFEDRYRDLVR